MRIKPIFLVDLDNCLVDYDAALTKALEKMAGPNEENPKIYMDHRQNRPEYIKERINTICSKKEWWANLPWLESGRSLFFLFREFDLRIMILTQGNRKNPEAWSGKMQWFINNIALEDVDITITRDKGLVYGKVLADDWPVYAENWLQHRPRGTVIMPVHNYNKDFQHPQVIKYDGSKKSLNIVSKKIEEIIKKHKDEICE